MYVIFSKKMYIINFFGITVFNFRYLVKVPKVTMTLSLNKEKMNPSAYITPTFFPSSIYRKFIDI